MGKCCSKPQVNHENEEETQEVLLEIDPGGGPPKMTGGTLLVSTPGRWGVPPGGHASARKAAFIATPGICGNRKPIITSNLGARQASTKGMVTKTFQFSGNGGSGTELRGVKSGRFVTTCQAFVSGTTQPANNLKYETNRRSSLSVTSQQKGKRMAKTKTETTVRTYTKDGKRYEETTVVETKEDDDGTITTTTKTTTKTLDAYSTKSLSNALDGAKTSTGGRKSSSSSSSDSSPTRVKSQPKNKAENKVSKGAFPFSKKSSSDDDEDFAKSVLSSVNDYREKHGVAKLKMSKELSKYAKEWAKKLAADEKMSHRPESKYGENVFCLSSNTTNFDVKPNEVVDKWYSEVKDHKFGEEPKGSMLKSGHFSQLVWKDTKQMGVGKARSAAGTKVFVVANFDPQGNWMGQFADQVPPVGGFPKSATSGKTSIFNRTRKSSSSSESESSSDEEDFAEDCLKAHNNYRKKHGVPPLKLSKKLNKVAKEWAETIAKKNVLQHRPNSQYGENLYCYYSPDPKFNIKGDEAVKSWYSEVKDFKYGMEPSDLRAGHFTQVVWADSKELGVARVKSKSGKTYVVANYHPPGNFVGSFGTKVPRPK